MIRLNGISFVISAAIRRTDQPAFFESIETISHRYVAEANLSRQCTGRQAAILQCPEDERLGSGQVMTFHQRP